MFTTPIITAMFELFFRSSRIQIYIEVLVPSILEQLFIRII